MKRMLMAATAAALAAGTALADGPGVPQYGGRLEVGSEHVTRPPISWDPADFPWKLNHDVGFYAEQLIAGDLTKSVGQGGPFRYVTDAWLPPEAQRGELAERWEVIDEPLSIVFHLRKGIMFPEKEGVMKARELVADDVVFSFNRLNESPKKIPGYFDHIEKVEARDKHTVVFHLKEWNSEWDYRFGWGAFSVIVPREMVEAGAGNWRNATGTGPFTLAEYVQGNSQTYKRRADYWDKLEVGGKEYQLPFVDQVAYRIIPDEAAQHAALRTGKLDILQTISWRAVEGLKKSAPQLQWDRRLYSFGTKIALRVDTKPFDDIRVRRALNMAINKQEIVSEFYGGNAELFNFPMHKEWDGYYQPLEEMPDSVKELYTYNPEKAKKLLAEAGYPNGFTFTTQVCPCRLDHMDLASLIAAYLEQIGVKMQIQPLESGAYLNALISRTNAAGYLIDNGHTNPTTGLRKAYGTNQVYNPARYSNPEFDEQIRKMYLMRDDEARKKLIREMTIHALDAAPYIYLPSPYLYQAWWPWVKNYHGELNVGAYRPAPVFARIWIDQELKKKMGY